MLAGRLQGHHRRGGCKHLDAGRADAVGVQPGQRGLAAHLQDLHLAHHRIAQHALAQPDQAVGHREHRVGVVLVEVFTEQKGGGLPGGHQHAQLLHELLQSVVR